MESLPDIIKLFIAFAIIIHLYNCVSLGQSFQHDLSSLYFTLSLFSMLAAIITTYNKNKLDLGLE
jgi:hypothetical protein